MKKQWGVFCTKEQVDEIKNNLAKAKLDVFEVRQLTAWEKMSYLKMPEWSIGEMWVVMFWATKWQYHRFIRRNKLNKVF